MVTRSAIAASLVLIGAGICAAPTHAHAAAAPAARGDLRRFIVRAQVAGSPCFNGFAAVQRDLVVLSRAQDAGSGRVSALVVDAQADQQACARAAHDVSTPAIPPSLRHNALVVDFTAHLHNALTETAHACADAVQITSAARTNNAATAHALVADFGRTVQQQAADAGQATADLLRLEAAFHL